MKETKIGWNFDYRFFVLFLGIGMDSSVTPLRNNGLSLVQTTDFFYPLVDDPYMMGMTKKKNKKKIELEIVILKFLAPK